MLTGDPEALSQPSGRLGSRLTAPRLPSARSPQRAPSARPHRRSPSKPSGLPGFQSADGGLSHGLSPRAGLQTAASSAPASASPRVRAHQGCLGHCGTGVRKALRTQTDFDGVRTLSGGGAPPRRRQEAVSERQASSCRCEGGRTGGDASRGKAAGVPHPARRQAVPRLGRGSLLCLRPWGGLSALRRSKLASPTAEPQGPVRAPGGLAAAASSSAGPAPRRRGRPLPCLAWRVPLHSSDHVDMPVLSAGTRGGQRGRKHTEGPLGASQSRRGTPQGVLPETSARFP